MTTIHNNGNNNTYKLKLTAGFRKLTLEDLDFLEIEYAHGKDCCKRLWISIQFLLRGKGLLTLDSLGRIFKKNKKNQEILDQRYPYLKRLLKIQDVAEEKIAEAQPEKKEIHQQIVPIQQTDSIQPNTITAIKEIAENKLSPSIVPPKIVDEKNNKESVSNSLTSLSTKNETLQQKTDSQKNPEVKPEEKPESLKTEKTEIHSQKEPTSKDSIPQQENEKIVKEEDKPENVKQKRPSIAKEPLLSEREKEEIAKNWNQLESLNRGLVAIVNIMSPEEVVHRFKNIYCPRETAIFTENNSCERKYLHANRIGQSAGLTREIFATQAPLPITQDLFWKIAFEKVDVIIDLTNLTDRTPAKGVTEYAPVYTPEEIKNPYREKKSIQYGDITVTIKEAYPSEHSIDYSIKIDDRYAPPQKLGTVNIYKYEVKNEQSENKIVHRLHFPEWPDHGAISPEVLAMIVDIIESKYPSLSLLIHCRAGVGRTGTLAAALIISEKVRSGEIHLENYKNKIDEIIWNLRRDRLGLVQELEQYELLHAYAKKLIRN